MPSPALSLPARSLETETLVPAAHVHDLIEANRQLRLDLASANAARDNLFKQLNYAVSAGKVVDTLVVDDMLTVVLSTGRVQQLQQRAIDAPRESGYRAVWVELPAVPGTAAASLADADDDRTLPFGMDVIDGDQEC